MDSALDAGPEVSRQPVGVEITEQEHALKKHQANRPYLGYAAKPRQDDLGDQQLNEEKEEGA